MTRRTRIIIGSVSATVVAVVGLLVKAQFKEKGPPFRVIWLRNGKGTHYQGKEPNGMVLEYLRWRAKKAAEAGAPTVASPPNPVAPPP